jgi:RNA polymerase sigma-70 factor, ECF subfamily
MQEHTLLQENARGTPLPLPTNVEPSPEWQRTSIDAVQFAEAFCHGYSMTLRFLLSRGAPGDLAEEIAQAAWVKGWECRDQLLRPHMIGAWVNSIAKNMLKNALRADRRQEPLTERSRTATPPVLVLDLKHILKKCDPRSSVILRGYYFEGYTTEEIAERVGLTPVTVRVRLLRLRRALRSQLFPVAGGLASSRGAANPGCSRLSRRHSWATPSACPTPAGKPAAA